MKWLFSVIGGSGSSFLIDSLEKCGYNVHKRPDNGWIVPNKKIKKRPYQQEIKSYSEIPDKKTFKNFRLRTRNLDKSGGYKLDEAQTIESNLLLYVKELGGDERKTAIFNTAPMFEFFSQNKLPNFALLVRHPMHAYLSYAKPQRHLNVINDLGGLYSESSIRWFADLWNGFVSEYLRLSDSLLIRFEYAKKDVSQDKELQKVFKDFDESKRNPCENSAADNLMKKLVAKQYFKIYDVWKFDEN
jgi:hypothetical protein